MLSLKGFAGGGWQFTPCSVGITQDWLNKSIVDKLRCPMSKAIFYPCYKSQTPVDFATNRVGMLLPVKLFIEHNKIMELRHSLHVLSLDLQYKA